MGTTGDGEVCPDCGQDVPRRYRVRATGQEFWLCEECDAVWPPGADRSVADFFYLSDLLPDAPNPWTEIERADGPPELPEGQKALRALADAAGKGELAGLALGMHRTDALVVAGVPRDGKAIGVVDSGDVSMAFEGDTLAGFSVRLSPHGVRWPGVMAVAAVPRLAAIPRAQALRVLEEAGFERLPGPSAHDRTAEFWGDGRRVRLDFRDGLLAGVAVFRASN